ncbi:MULTISPECIES: sulfatase [unclassified Nocardioides]|uniref:sulfatase family protein n=1 Tax=unclassified Nocardioides TaxID=2615069 RepID=UPI00361634B4
MVTGRPARALLATLAVSALAVVGIDDPSRVPESAREALTPTPTPAFTMPVDEPNVLMVTVDDLAVDDMRYLPHVRELMGTGGVEFADGLAPSPMCVPARASLLTGQYAHNHGAKTVRGPSGGYQAFHDQDQTIAKALKDRGYATLFAGKYLNGYGKNKTARDVPPGWTDWRATPDPSTYRFFDQRLNVNGTVQRQQGYTTDVMTDQAADMITGVRRGKPWFAWVNYVAPHVGSPVLPDDPKKKYAGTSAARFKTTVPDPQDRGHYRDVPLPTTLSSFQDGAPDLPPWAPANVRTFDDLQQKVLAEVHQRRIEAARGLDRAFAKLVGLLERTNQLDRTLVIFTSDNGYAIGNHNLNGKLYHYEESVGIPIYMRGPGLPAGVTVPTAVTNPDIAATILAATRTEPPRPLDGVDILPWIDAPAQVRVVPIEGYEVSGSRRIYWGVRVGDWTYVRYRKGGAELYNRTSDQDEVYNLARVKEYAPVRKALASLAMRYRGCAGESCPKEFYPADELAELVEASDA